MAAAGATNGGRVLDEEGAVDAHDELDHEQKVVDTLYSRLDELRDRAGRRLRTVRREGPSGSPQNRSERDAFATLYEDRLAQLQAVEDRLVFGRLDLDDGATRYVGRIGLTDEDHGSLLTDWRAPAAQAFYRATAARPDGVARRRQLITRRRRVAGLDDELLDAESAGRLGLEALAGEGALLAALTEGRSSRMRDIVATIQREQDEIVRAPLAGALVVQGGPGTGKTAVALHRTAYLLYAHRRVLERSGVLLVGPSRAFLRYIDQVLPSLGETGVVATTLGDLVPGFSASGEEDPRAAEIKGRAVWSRVVARAVRARERVPEHDVGFRIEGHDLVIRRDDVRDAISRARRTHRPHNEARRVFVREMLSRLARQYALALGDEPGGVDPSDLAELTDDLRRHRDVRVTLNLAWLPITPARLLEDLYTKPHRLAQAAPELTGRDRELLARPAGSPWTVADVPLLDEAAELLGEDDQLARDEARARTQERAAELEYARSVLESSGAGGGLVDAETLAGRFSDSGPALTTAEHAASDRTWAYGHVVVDEAQELSAMAWRSLVRRCPTRSFTIVGDVAQTTALGGSRSWSRTMSAVFRDGWSLAELTVNYRTPAEVADAAVRFARGAGLPTSTLRSARDVPGSLRLVDVGAGSPDAVVAAESARAARDLHAAAEGRLAVLAAPGRREAIRSVVESAVRSTLGDDASALLAGGTDARIVVLSPAEAKGLEFDVVVLVGPDEVTADAPGQSGASDLFVAMTRPTRELVVVHRGSLPAGIAG
jgi:DNA helicase IV